MKKNRLLFILITIAISFVCMFGCESVDIPEEDEGVYIAYMVNSVINHDKNYILKLKDVEIETESTTVWHSEDENVTNQTETSGSNGGSSQEEETTVINVNTDINSIVQIPGIDITYNSYLVCTSYPETSDAAFIMKAVNGSSLIVLKFNVANTTSEDINIDFLSEGYKFKGIFNGTVKANCQTTLLDNALNTYNSTIAASSSKELVLVYEVSNSSISSVSTIKVEISKGEKNETIIIEK